MGDVDVRGLQQEGPHSISPSTQDFSKGTYVSTHQLVLRNKQSQNSRTQSSKRLLPGSQTCGQWGRLRTPWGSSDPHTSHFQGQPCTREPIPPMAVAETPAGSSTKEVEFRSGHMPSHPISLSKSQPVFPWIGPGGMLLGGGNIC